MSATPREAAPANSDARAEARHRFLKRAGWGDAKVSVLAADASFRSYHRARRDGGTAVLMDAPPDKEKPGDFVVIAARLNALGLSAPKLLAADLDSGFLLLEDLGDRTYTVALADNDDETGLYEGATDTLIALHQRWQPDMAGDLRPYDEAMLLEEAALLADWTLSALFGSPPNAKVRAAYLDAWREVLPQAAGLPETLVLRDYHVDNLMALSGRVGVAACGLLDFQDAVLGSPAYDLVSLLKDARRDVPGDLAERMLARYLAARPDIDPAAFQAAYRVLGAQRNAKVIGIFTRLSRRDGKPRYLVHMPRLWRLMEQDLADPILAPVAAWFARHLPPEARRTPGAST